MTTNYLVFNKEDLLILEESQTLSLPSSKDIPSEDFASYVPFTLSQSSDETYYLYDVDDSFVFPSGYYFRQFRECRTHLLEAIYQYATSGFALLNWSRKHQHCGVCGAKFNPMNPDKSKKCPDCGNLLFPQTSMAVITAILKDDKILLAHNVNFPDNLYSLVAGFVELGETLENAVAREIQEEVGLKVKNIRYFGSQPWPFPNSMMIGFVADYDSGEIKTDDIEIEDAGWFDLTTFPDIPHEYSIARQIIEAFVGKTL